MKKKGFSMSFEVIITGILVIVVLIILLTLIIGKTNTLKETCASKGGQCLSQTTNKECEGGKLIMLTQDCPFINTDGTTKQGEYGQCCTNIG